MESVQKSSWRRIEELVREVASGEESSWPALMVALEPKLTVLVRYQKIGRLRRREDDLRNIVVRVFEKLSADEYRALRRFCEMDGAPSFQSWLRRVVKSSAIDYMRQHAEYRRRSEPVSGDESDVRWISLATLSTGIGQAGADSMADKRRVVYAEVARAADEAEAVGRELGTEAAAELARRWQVKKLHGRRFIDRGQRMRQVLELLFQGHRYGSIADQLGISRREVELSLRCIEEFLGARWPHTVE